MLLPCQHDCIRHALLFVGAVRASATDINISVRDDDSLHLPESELPHIYPFCLVLFPMRRILPF